MLISGNSNKPGEQVPQTTTYWVHHYAHRMPHQAILRAGEVFPSCRVCGDRVRFEATVIVPPGTAEPIQESLDFDVAA